MSKNIDFKKEKNRILPKFENNVIVDFSSPTVWASTKMNEFTNFLVDDNQFYKYHLHIFNEIVSLLKNTTVQDAHKNFKHYCVIDGTKRTEVNSIIYKLLEKVKPTSTSTQLNEYLEQNFNDQAILEIGIKSVLLIGYYQNNIFNVIFVDYHHLLFPDVHYNSKDSDIYDICPYNRAFKKEQENGS